MIRIVSFTLFGLLQLMLGAVAQECASCHALEQQEWQSSQHALAMQEINEATVLGDFSSSYQDSQVTAQFQLQEGVYSVRLKEKGTPETVWTIQYVIGIAPLQQYLIDIGDGKIQALNIAWDTRPKEIGGQRWFRLDEQTPHQVGHPMHWQGIYQNWNGMCADCHVTNFEKHYEASSDSFRSKWRDINVSCAACHQQAEEHERKALIGEYVSAGMQYPINTFAPGRSVKEAPKRLTANDVDDTTLTCGRCHSLRTKLHNSPGFKVGEDYSLTRLFSPLYAENGHINDEVYVLGSFMQSKMYQAGVTCINCHNAHTGQLVIPGNGVCAQCHDASVYDATPHHKHQVSGTGPMCIDCHMPVGTFMTVDQRREHSFSIPSSNASQELLNQNECLTCHTDKNANWVSTSFLSLWPNHDNNHLWSAPRIKVGSTVLSYIQNQQEPELRRATVIEENAELLAQHASSTLLDLLEDDDGLIRESAWRAASYLSKEELANKISAGLNDKLLAVRLSAYNTLSSQKMDTSIRAESDTEYREYLSQISDRPSGLVISSDYHISNGRLDMAQKDLKKAIELDPYYIPARIKLIELYRSLEKVEEAMGVIEEGLAYDLERFLLIHYKGLLQIKQKRYQQAIDSLKEAAYGDPDSFIFTYRYVLVLALVEQESAARKELKRAKQLFPQRQEWSAIEARLSR